MAEREWTANEAAELFGGSPKPESEAAEASPSEAGAGGTREERLTAALVEAESRGDAGAVARLVSELRDIRDAQAFFRAAKAGAGQATDASGLPPGLGTVDLEREQRREEEKAEDDGPPRDDPEAYAAWWDRKTMNLLRLREANAQRARHAEQPQEQRLEQDVARFAAAGNTVAAAIAANEPKLVRQAQPWQVGAEQTAPSPPIQASTGPRQEPPASGEGRPARVHPAVLGA